MRLAADWGSQGVTGNCLAPGWFRIRQNEIIYKNAAWMEYLTDRLPVKRPRGRPTISMEQSFFSHPSPAVMSQDRHFSWMAVFRPALPKVDCDQAHWDKRASGHTAEIHCSCSPSLCFHLPVAVDLRSKRTRLIVASGFTLKLGTAVANIHLTGDRLLIYHLMAFEICSRFQT